MSFIQGSINSEGYIHIGIDGTLYKAHRLAWFYVTGELPKDQLDHINGTRTDNRFINLRQACNELNQKNNALRKDNLSGVPGVMWNIETGKWRSRITSSGKRYLLGDFKDKFEAICARKSAEVKYGFHLNHGRR